MVTLSPRNSSVRWNGGQGHKASHLAQGFNPGTLGWAMLSWPFGPDTDAKHIQAWYVFSAV
jgi:hypothetical protein